MAKTGQWDFRTGSFVDKISGTVPTMTNVLSRQTSKGMSLFSNNNASVDTNILSSSLLGASGTIEVWFKSNPTLDGDTQYLVMTQRTTNGSSYMSLIITATGKLQGYYLNNTGSVDTTNLVGTDTLVNDKLYHAMLVKSGASIKMYLDNVLIDSVADAGTAVGAYNAFFCSTHAGVNNLSGNILLVRTYNEAISDIQRDINYSEFVNSQPIAKPKRGFVYPKPTDLKKEVNKTVTNLNLPIINSTGWSGSNWIISSGSASITSNGGDLYTNTAYMLGSRTYSYDITCSISGGTLTIIDYNATVLATLTNGRNVGTFTNSSFTGTRFFYIRAGSGTTATVSSVNISLLSGLIAAYNMKPNGLTLVDISGNGYNATLNRGAINQEDGVRFAGTASAERTELPQITVNGSYTVACRFKILENKLSVLWGNGNSGADRNGLTLGATGAISYEKYNGSAYSGIRSNASIYPVGQYLNVVCINTAGTHTLYINGEAVTYSTSVLGELGNNGSRFIIGADLATGGARPSNTIFQDFKVYNRALSAQEAKDYHNQFAKQVYLAEDFSDAPADGTSIVPREWHKISGTFKAGEINLTQGNLVGNGYFESGITGAGITTGTGGNAALSHEIVSPITGVGSLRITQTTQPSEAFRPHLSINLTKTLELDKTYSVRFKSRLLSGAVKFSAGNGVQLGLAASQAYLVNEVFTGTQQWSIVAKSTAVNNTILMYFNGSLSPFDLLLDDIEVVEIPPLPTLTKGSKYLECVTAGVLAIPSNQAFGTWEFDWYKGADGNYSYIYFVSNNLTELISGVANNYRIGIQATENIQLAKWTGGTPAVLSNTANSYVANNTWYRTKITRSIAGVFTTLIKGGTFTPTAGYDGWTLVSVTGGSGANPATDTTYTTSNYMLLNLKAGDRITNIKLTSGVIV